MPGSLAWAPPSTAPTSSPHPWPRPSRRSHPEYAATVRMVAIDPGLADTAEFCAAYGVGLDISANCVVLALRRGEDRSLAACVVLATTRADVNGRARRALDARKASFAPMDVAVAETGMEHGVTPPGGLPASRVVVVGAVVAGAAGGGGRGRRRSAPPPRGAGGGAPRGGGALGGGPPGALTTSRAGRRKAASVARHGSRPFPGGWGPCGGGATKGGLPAGGPGEVPRTPGSPATTGRSPRSWASGAGWA